MSRDVQEDYTEDFEGLRVEVLGAVSEVLRRQMIDGRISRNTSRQVINDVKPALDSAIRKRESA